MSSQDINLLLIDDIVKLIEQKKETPNLDYKRGFIWDNSNNEQRIEITKDILAMANTQDGGKLVIGVEDESFEFTGVSDVQYKSFDTTKINSFLHKYSDPVFNCSVIKQKIGDKKVIIIDIPEFREVPIFCKKQFHSPNGNILILKQGGLYIRTDACESTIISTADQMRSLMSRSLLKKKDDLIGTIDKLISGKVSENIKEPDKYKGQVTSALSLFKSKIENFDTRGKILIFIKPSEFEERFTDQVSAGKAVEESLVRLRGWDFPHMDSHGNLTNFSDGKQSVTISERVQHQEAWRINKSGLFSWTMVLLEDLRLDRDQYGKVLSFVGVIYLITEIMLFTKRLYGEKLGVENLFFQIVLTDCDNRTLFSNDTWTLESGRYRCLEPKISIKRNIQTAELSASFKDVAKMFIKEIFMMFNWDNPNDSMLEGWQEKLIEKGG